MARNDPDAFLPALEALLDQVRAVALRLNQADARSGLHTGEIQVLQVLAEQGHCSVPHIGRVRHTSRQSVQTIVNQLQAQGAVELLPNPAHRRSPLVRITEKGRGRLRLSQGRRPALIETELLMPEEIASALSILKRLHDGLSGQPPTPASKPVRSAPPALPKAIPAPLMTEEMELVENELPVNLL
jgi:DNA-binding MarR family transcriptional regulator